MRIKRAFATPRRKIAAVAAVVGLVACGVALAAWFTSGSGPGYGKAGSLSALVVTSAATSPDTCMPGGPACSFAAHVQNNNDVAMTITALLIQGGTKASWTTDPACPIGYWDPALTPDAPVPSVVPANGSADIVWGHALTLALAAPTGCQGTSVQPFATVTGTPVV